MELLELKEPLLSNGGDPQSVAKERSSPNEGVIDCTSNNSTLLHEAAIIEIDESENDPADAAINNQEELGNIVAEREPFITTNQGDDDGGGHIVIFVRQAVNNHAPPTHFEVQIKWISLWTLFLWRIGSYVVDFGLDPNNTQIIWLYDKT
jgi:hypothetical protein